MFLLLRDEYRFSVFQKRMLRREFGPKRMEVTGAWSTGAQHAGL
jgi:hypothetical protein